MFLIKARVRRGPPSVPFTSTPLGLCMREREGGRERDKALTIHKRNLQKLIVKIYTSINQLTLHICRIYLRRKWWNSELELRYSASLRACELPPARSQRFDINSLEYKARLLWNGLSDEIKTAKSLAIFKQKIKSTHCTCKIYRS